MASTPSRPVRSRVKSKPTAPRSTYASGGMVQRSSCCTASAQRATCGVIWRAHSSKTTWLSRPTCAGCLSSKPDGGYDKKNQAADVVGVLDALGVRTAELVTHDIGIMVGFAVAATHP